jgi:hypothetical protein
MSTTIEIKNFENLLVGDGNLRLHDIRIHDGMIFELSYVRVRLLPEITNQFKKSSYEGSASIRTSPSEFTR